MLLLFLVAITAVVYTYGLYPATVALIGLIRPTSWRRDEAVLPAVTLIISAYNEEDVIADKLENSLALDYPRARLQMIVASESTDGTNAIAERFAPAIELHTFSGRRGKSATLRRVMPRASGDIVVFSDANAAYRPETIRKLVRNFADHRVGAVIGDLRYREASSAVGGRGETVYWRYDHWLRRHASRAMSIIPGITGSVFAIRRELYVPLSEERGDDYELCTGIAIRGRAVVFDGEAIAEERAGETTRQQFRRKIRLVRWNTASSLLLIRDALRFGRPFIAWQVLSHRLLRYTVPLWLMLALVASIGLAGDSTLFTWIVGAQVGFYAVGALGWLAETARITLPRICLIPSYFVMVNTAAFCALVAGATRGQVTTWQKQR